MAFFNKINIKNYFMKNKLIIIVLFSIIQIFSTSCSDKKKSNDFVFSDSIATASSANTDMLNKSNGIADFVAASKAVTPAVVHIKTLLKPSTGKTNFRKPYRTQSRSNVPAMASGSGI
jgi:hypothetical protein